MSLTDLIPADELQEARTGWRKWALGRQLAFESLLEADFTRAEALHITAMNSLPVADFSGIAGAYTRMADAMQRELGDGDDA